MLMNLVMFLVVIAVGYGWLDTMRARDVARRIGRQVCERANVQLLDQSVALYRLKMVRLSSGRLGLSRHYRFELSTNGHDRHRGTLRICDGRLEEYSLPVVATADAGLALPVSCSTTIHPP
jgi:hypothetical protein